MKGIYRLAGLNIEISSINEGVHRLCSDYLSDASDIDFSIETSQEDIDFEREKSAREDAHEGVPVRNHSDNYLETLAAYRKIAEKLPEHDVLLIHGSALSIDGNGVLFMAKSGMGKSTHAGLWRSVFGERVVMINDDKPLIRLRDGKATVCGTPWDGKHRLSTNMEAPLKAICILERGDENRIASISADEAYPALLQQTYRPFDPDALRKTLALIDELVSSVSFWNLRCNMDSEAASVAYKAMEAYLNEAE